MMKYILWNCIARARLLTQSSILIASSSLSDCTCACHRTPVTPTPTSTRPDLARFASKSPTFSITELDGEIARLLQATKALQHHRNSLLPVLRLPAEVLCRIFEELAPNHSKPALNLKWISFTHVSQRWREVALNYAALWSCIPTTTSPEVVKEFLERSKDAPLTFGVPYPDLAYPSKRDPTWLNSTQLAFSHISRARHVSFQASQEYDFGPLAVLNNDHAPTLKTLELRGYAHPKTHALAPEPVFSENTPNLRKLRLSDVIMTWPLSLPSSLTSLELTRCYSNWDRPSLDQLCNMLKSLPAIRHLHLRNILPSGQPGDAVLPQEQIHLRHLSFLSVSDSGIFCAAFVQKISVNPTCSISVQCTEGGPLEDLPLEVLNNFTLLHHKDARLHRRSSHLLCAVALQPTSSAGILFRETWYDPKLEGAAFSIPHAGGHLVQHFIHLRVTCSNLLRQRKRLVDGIVWDDINRFECEGRWDNGTGPSIFKDARQLLSDVKEIFVTGALTSRELLDALSREKPTRHLERADLFPSLHTIIVKGVLFDGSNMAQRLSELLYDRTGGIHKVVFSSCWNVPSELAELSNVEVVENWSTDGTVYVFYDAYSKHSGTC